MTDATEQKDIKKNTRVLRGVVVSDKMQDTIVVAVTRYVKHPKYKKFIKRVKRYKVHSPNNTLEVGAQVAIREIPPVSKTKHFEVMAN